MRPFHALGRLNVDAALKASRPQQQQRQKQQPRHQRTPSPNEDAYRYAQTPGLTPKAEDHFIEPPMSKMQRFSAMSERHGLHLGKYEKMFSKFGFWMLGLSILSAVLLTISIGFLSWIWFADRDQELWRRLMLGPYNSRSITLTGVAVRYAIACLGWITVAMMASVVVEMYGVPADKIAQASIARYTGSLLPLMFGGFALRKWFKILIPLQMACAIYSQFTSTLLFSDVGVVSIKNFPENRVVNYDFRATKVNNETGALQKDITSMPTNDYVMSGIQLIPTEFQPFAELAQPELASTREEVDDTGPVIRAFLPIGDRSTRDNIESYSGMMRVVDARTICVRPNITEFSIGRPGAPFNFNGNRTLVSDQRDTTNYPFYNGTATIDTSLVPEILDQNRTITIYFECYLLTTKTRTAVEQGTPSDTTPDPNDHYWEQCDTFQEQKQPFPRIVPQNDPLYYNRDRIGELGPETFQDVVEGPNGSAVNTLATGKLAAIRDFRLGSSFLLTDGLEPRRWLFPVNPEGSDLAYGHPLPILDQTSDGPWARIKSRLPANETLNLPGDPIAQRRDVDINFQATFCFDAISPEQQVHKYFNLDVTGSKGRAQEPIPVYNQDTVHYDTREVARQLGATASRLSDADRGIWTIQPESWARQVDDVLRPAPLDELAPRDDLSVFMYGLRNGDDALAFCSDCRDEIFNYGYTTQYWVSLFQSIMNDTARPALAVQAANTERMRLAYMGGVNAYTEGDLVRMTLFTQAQVPVRYLGYGAVMALIATQLTLVAISGWLFRGTKNSLLNNAWHVLAQVSTSAEAAHLLPHARTMTDMDVRKYAMSEDGEKILGSPIDPGDGPVRYVLEGGTFKPRVVKASGWQNFRWKPVRRPSTLRQ